MTKKGSHQVRHTRTSKKGKVYGAGKGVKKYSRKEVRKAYERGKEAGKSHSLADHFFRGVPEKEAKFVVWMLGDLGGVRFRTYKEAVAFKKKHPFYLRPLIKISKYNGD